MRLWKALLLVLTLALVCGVPAFAQSTGGKTPATRGTTGAASASATSAASAAPASSAEPASPAPAAAPAGSAAPARSAGPGAGANAPPAVDGATYLVRLRDLEQRVDELKEQIRRSHTRLSLLSETILSNGTGGARAEVTFINDMSSAFNMTRALFVLDGAVQYNKQDESGVLASQKEIPIFTGSIPPGDHTLQVLVQLRGHGYGVFSYLQGYRFEIRSSHSFTVTEGKTVELRAIAFEKGGVTTPIEQRPAVRYVEKIRAGVQGEDAAPASSDDKKAGPAKVGVSVGTRSE